MLAAGLGGVVSQYALQVSRLTPRGKVEGDLAREVTRPTPNWEVEGGLVWEASRPTPGGPAPRRGACSWGGACSRGAAPGGLLHGGLLQGGVQTPVTTTAAGGTNPTGMHSCYNFQCQIQDFPLGRGRGEPTQRGRTLS